jgi:hypothetical protein
MLLYYKKVIICPISGIQQLSCHRSSNAAYTVHSEFEPQTGPDAQTPQIEHGLTNSGWFIFQDSQPRLRPAFKVIERSLPFIIRGHGISLGRLRTFEPVEAGIAALGFDEQQHLGVQG